MVSVPILDSVLGGEMALDFYYRTPDPALSAQDWTDLGDAAFVTAALLAASVAVHTVDTEPLWLTNAVHAWAQVWVAMGMLSVALRLSTEDALAVLRGYAFSHDATVDEVARCLTTRQLPVEAVSN